MHLVGVWLCVHDVSEWYGACSVSRIPRSPLLCGFLPRGSWWRTLCSDTTMQLTTTDAGSALWMAVAPSLQQGTAVTMWHMHIGRWSSRFGHWFKARLGVLSLNAPR